MPQNCYENIELNDLMRTVSACWPSRQIPFIFSKTSVGIDFFPWSLLFPQRYELPEMLKTLIRDAFVKIGNACHLEFYEVDALPPLIPSITLTNTPPISESKTAATLLNAWGQSISYAVISIFKHPFWYDVINEIQFLERVKNTVPNEDISLLLDLLNDHPGYPTKHKIIKFIGDNKISSYIEFLKRSMSEVIKHEILHAIGLNHPHEDTALFEHLQKISFGTNCTIMDYDELWPDTNCNPRPITKSGLGPLDVDLCKNITFDKIKTNAYPYYKNLHSIWLHTCLLILSNMLSGFIIGFTSNLNINHHQFISNNTAYILGSLSSILFLYYAGVSINIALTTAVLSLSTRFHPGLSKMNILLPLICLLTFTYQQHWNGLFNSPMEIGIELVKMFILLLINSKTTSTGYILGSTASQTLSQSINSLFFTKTTPENLKKNDNENIKAAIK